MIKLSVFLTRRPDLSRDEFRNYWTGHHAPFLQGLPEVQAHVRRYVQQHATDGLPDGLPVASYDGVAELWFDDVASALTAMGSENYATVVAEDEERFLDRSRTVMMMTAERLGVWPDKA